MGWGKIIKKPNNIHNAGELMNIISIRVNFGLSIIDIVIKYRSGPHENHSPHIAAEDATLF
jgi:hypothetical protein